MLAGSGADATPYFRVFNSISQVKKFSAEAYVRRWCLELENVPDKFLGLPDGQKRMLNLDYPEPIVGYKVARERYLETAKAFLDTKK